ncbi:hypothetical protein SCHPADRAFT_120135 [Schizopora paradoxa]|uniref:Uncharacterized protein n=1 Tax=Schizopora paradoxa TaxID=27342 RepID=A0A0H2S2G3_9AGAM|nr:hypothetical protein SCHPADRAFT_120135 [Schizopora paradoxa]
MTSPRPKVCPDAATFAEDLFELVETRDGSEYVLVEELQKEKEILNAFDYVGISQESAMTKKDVVSRSKSLRNTFETAVATSQGVIRCLEQELEDACDLEERIMSMCGLASLPTELLGRIFHFAIEINRGSILAINISHVCRLFREVTIHTPSLWSTIDVVYSEYESTPSLAILNACLERSKNSPLYIHIKFGEADDSSSRNVRSKKCLSALIQHSFRWSSFELELEVVDSQTYLQLLQDFVNINTPNLLELKIDSVTPWMYGESEQKSLASTWNAPKLQRFHVVNQYPFPSDQSVDLANIKEAHIRFDYGGVWDQDCFLGSLSRLSSLSELNLEIGDTVPFYLEEGIPPVSLNTVQIYRVGLYHIDGFDDLLSLRVLGALRCPSARHLSLIIYKCCNSIIVPTLRQRHFSTSSGLCPKPSPTVIVDIFRFRNIPSAPRLWKSLEDLAILESVSKERRTLAAFFHWTPH